MRFILLLIVTLVVSNFATAQYSSFIELNTGEKVFGKVELEAKFLKKTKLVLNDTTQYSLDRVKAYKNRDGYFVRMNGYGDDFAKRISENGRVELFVREMNTAGSWIPGPNGTSMYMGPGKSSTTYFRKDEGTLKRANKSNLKIALADNPKSMSYLNKHDGLTAVQVIGSIVGVSLIGLSVSKLTKLEDDENYNPIGFFFGGAVVAGSIWIPHIQKQGLTEDAIDAYNKRY